MSEPREKQAELRELYRDQRFTGLGVRKLYLALRAAGIEDYTQADVADALRNISEHAVSVHQPQMRYSYVPHALGEQEWDLAEFKHGRERLFLFVAIDVLSKRVWAVAMKRKNAATVVPVARHLLELTRPTSIRADVGSEFVSRAMGSLFSELGIRLQPTRSKARVVERVIGTLRRLVQQRFAITPESSLEDTLDSSVSAYNNSVHRSITMTPLRAHEEPGMWMVARAELLKRARLPQDGPDDDREFAVGDVVLSSKPRGLVNKQRAQFWSRSRKHVVAVDNNPVLDSGLKLSDGASGYRASMLRHAEDLRPLLIPSVRARAPAATAPSSSAASSSSTPPPRVSARTLASARTRGRPDYATAASGILNTFV